jgi:ribosome-associated protein
MDRAGKSRSSCIRHEEAHLEALDLAHVIADKLEEHQAVNIVVLELTELTSFTDFFVICTAESDRQAKTLKDLLSEELRHEYVTAPLSTEGEPASGWMLLDYNTVIVHIFSPQGRAFYRLEELWNKAPVVLKIQ